MLSHYWFFYLVEKYPMIISTPRNPHHANAQSPNRSTGTCAPEFTVSLVSEQLYVFERSCNKTWQHCTWMEIIMMHVLYVYIQCVRTCVLLSIVSFSASGNTELDPETLFVDSRFSHTQQLQSRLDFVRYSTRILYYTSQYSIVQHSIVRTLYFTVQYSTAQYSVYAILHSTV